MNPRLRVEVGRQADFEYEIPPASEQGDVWLGRGAFCKIRISDPQLSRRHCSFRYDAGRLIVQDLDSQNGTRVNGQRIQGPVELSDGDHVIAGSHEFLVTMPRDAEAAESGPDFTRRVEELEANEQMESLVGTGFAGYRLQDIAHNGQFSTIYRARDPQGGRTVAVKVLKNLSTVTAEDRNRFIRGGKHSTQLKHPNFVRVFKGGRFQEWYFLAMEYLTGRNLEECLELNEGPLALTSALKIIRQILEALQYAYEHQMVFRAVRPDNVVVCEGMKVKMVDYDLLKPVSGRQDAQVTRVIDGSLNVDPAFAAPELIAYPVVADQKADIFGAGAVLYYMLCGQPPFGAHLPGNKATSAFDRRLREPHALNPDIPDGVARVIKQALSDYERYPTPVDMLHSLERVTAQADSGQTG